MSSPPRSTAALRAGKPIRQNQSLRGAAGDEAISIEGALGRSRLLRFARNDRVCGPSFDDIGRNGAFHSGRGRRGPEVRRHVDPYKRKPFDDARVRQALSLAIDRWAGAPKLAKITNVHTVGGIVVRASPLAADKDELADIAGFWPDVEKSRAEARRLLTEPGAEGLGFELLNRNIDQPHKYNATWVIDE
jgi:hypothetical protein